MTSLEVNTLYFSTDSLPQFFFTASQLTLMVSLKGYNIHKVSLNLLLITIKTVWSSFWSTFTGDPHFFSEAKPSLINMPWQQVFFFHSSSVTWSSSALRKQNEAGFFFKVRFVRICMNLFFLSQCSQFLWASWMSSSLSKQLSDFIFADQHFGMCDLYVWQWRGSPSSIQWKYCL